MSAAWVAGSVRARAMASRRIGTAGVRALASAGSLQAAVDALAHSPYGPRVRGGDTLPAAARGVAASLLWNLRVLAGWLPAKGAEMLRALAGWFEIANVDEHLHALAGHGATAPFELGTLAMAWPQLARTSSLDELRDALTASVWGDPRGSTAREIQLSMRFAWADRVVARVPQATSWALGAVALVLAREQVARQVPVPDGAAARATALVGPGWITAGSLDALRAGLPMAARWALDDLTDIVHLWLWEVRWWRRVRAEARALWAHHAFGPDRVVGAAALLAADAWLVIGALETAARGPAGSEVLDALA